MFSGKRNNEARVSVSSRELTDAILLSYNNVSNCINLNLSQN